MSDKTILRVIRDIPREGPVNMAIDEGLLHRADENHCIPVLRLYRWTEPTISLGYFQKASEIGEQSERVRAMPFVRRPTGGGAILHDEEITYSLTLPFRALQEPPAIEEMYTLVHDAFIGVLARMGVTVMYRGGKDPEHSVGGPFFCFARTYRLDLTLEGEKLLGSAQRRIRNAAMQHGSFILKRTHIEQPSAALISLLTEPFDEAEFIHHIGTAVAKRLDLEPVFTSFSDSELMESERFLSKYSGDEWNRKK